MPHYNALLWRGQSLANLAHKRPAKCAKRPGRKQTKLPIDKILEARARHEYAAWSAIKLAKHYEIDLAYMRRILGYETASREYPSIEHLNLNGEDYVLDTRLQDRAFGIREGSSNRN